MVSAGQMTGFRERGRMARVLEVCQCVYVGLGWGDIQSYICFEIETYLEVKGLSIFGIDECSLAQDPSISTSRLDHYLPSGLSRLSLGICLLRVAHSGATAGVHQEKP